MCVKTWVWGNSVCHIFLCCESVPRCWGARLSFYLDCACSPLQQHRARGPTAGWRWPRANKSLYFDSLLEWSAENTIRLMEVRKYLVVIQKSLLLCEWRCNMMILIVEYTLALYSKNTEQMIISNPLLFFNVQKVILYIFFLFHLLTSIFFKIRQNLFFSLNL